MTQPPNPPVSETAKLPVSQSTSQPISRTRYLRVVRYFAGVFAQFIFWEILLRHLLGHRFVQRSATRRWQRIAARNRTLAVELGGVLIKLGQFLSIRVDVLPEVVTAELSGLQDAVPAESLAAIQAVVEAEFGRPLDQIFGSFAPQPEAAASLAQVHCARLLDGRPIVAKVQRPDIERTVETDLRAIHLASRWLKRYRPVRRRVDLDRIYDEFSRTTRAELDFVAEAHNAQQFAQNFAGDPTVRVPQVYAEFSTRRVLVMEDVANIKITDFAAIEAAGIDRREVARRLFDTYLKQLFVHNFVHADPHPGNLFVEPLPPSPETPLPDSPASFRLVFVDFGMMATVPQRVRQHLRDYLLGFVTHDTGRMIRAYQGAGVLMPGADLARLEQMESELMERYSGLTMREAREMAMAEWQNLAHEYRDILYEMPFQFPADLLFVGRAIAILVGMTNSMDPDLDPWQAIEPFAKQMAADEARFDWRSLLGELEKGARLLLSLPSQANSFFSQANQGRLAVQAHLAPETTHLLRRLETALHRLTAAILFAALLLAAVVLQATQGPGPLPTLFFVLSAIAFLAALFRP
jgi:predicted unusual protein kinase regulating ubiquinone biosynthesis (AarF/ABC1/UbiB family)